MSKVRERTEAKELRLSQPFVMSKEEWLQRGGEYRGTLGQAMQQGYYTVRCCERMGQPVSKTEFEAAKDFAMFMNCYMANCLPGGKRPYLPVFWRQLREE